MDILKFPCKECNTDELTVLPAPNAHVAECIFCGHPNDVPRTIDLQGYARHLKIEKWNADGLALSGVVVFFDVVDGALIEMGRADYENGFHALERYANTPNPASQLLYYVDDETRTEALNELALNIVTPEWLEDLFNQI